MYIFIYVKCMCVCVFSYTHCYIKRSVEWKVFPLSLNLFAVSINVIFSPRNCPWPGWNTGDRRNNLHQLLHKIGSVLQGEGITFLRILCWWKLLYIPIFCTLPRCTWCTASCEESSACLIRTIALIGSNNCNAVVYNPCQKKKWHKYKALLGNKDFLFIWGKKTWQN